MLCVDIHTHRHDGCAATLHTAGIHPWQADECDIADAAALAARLGSDPRQRLDSAQAIGETGLDRACTAPVAAQERLFRAHLELAVRRQLPVVVHCVRAFEQTMKILGEYRLPAVIFHGFIGSPEQALRAVGCGYRLSFGVRSMRSPRTVAAMRAVPAASIFLETDDDPAPIAEVYDMAASLLGCSVTALEEQMYENYKRLIQNG